MTGIFPFLNIILSIILSFNCENLVHRLAPSKIRHKLACTDIKMSSKDPNFRNHVKQLREMFPQHSQSTIERVLSEKKNNIDRAITVLLDTPPSGSSGHSQPSSMKPKDKSSKHRHSGSSPSNFVHIFPPDFLRWPPDAEVQKETFGDVQPQSFEPQFVFEPTNMDVSNDFIEAFSNQPIERKSKHKVSQKDKKSQLKGWEKFKLKFKRKDGKTYSQI